MTLELKVPPVAVFLVAVVLMVMLGDLASAGADQPRTAAPVAPAVPVTLPYLVAAALAGLGIGVAFLGVHEFRRAGTTVDPRYPERTTRLVTSGIYRYTRNPMYLGMLLILAAIAASLHAPAPWVVLPLFVVYIARFQIRPEERAMATVYGEAYAQYCARVRAWI